MVARLGDSAFPPMMNDFGALVEAMLNLVRDGPLFAGVLEGRVAAGPRPRRASPGGHGRCPPRRHQPAQRLVRRRTVVASWTAELAFATTRSPTSPPTSPTTSPRYPMSTRSSSRARSAGRPTTTSGRLSYARPASLSSASVAQRIPRTARSGAQAHADTRPVPRHDHAWRAAGDARAAPRARHDVPRRLTAAHGS